MVLLDQFRAGRKAQHPLAVRYAVHLGSNRGNHERLTRRWRCINQARLD